MASQSGEPAATSDSPLGLRRYNQEAGWFVRGMQWGERAYAVARLVTGVHGLAKNLAINRDSDES